MIPLLAFLGVFFGIPLACASRNAYCARVALGLDLLGSALTNGRPGETLSGRCGTAYLEGHFRGQFWCPIINWIMGSPVHCIRAIHGDIMRAQAVIADDHPYDWCE